MNTSIKVKRIDLMRTLQFNLFLLFYIGCAAVKIIKTKHIQVYNAQKKDCIHAYLFYHFTCKSESDNRRCARLSLILHIETSWNRGAMQVLINRYDTTIAFTLLTRGQLRFQSYLQSYPS